jgi:protein-S-isoprenylcysteine O-methyltransferase Ste14
MDVASTVPVRRANLGNVITPHGTRVHSVPAWPRPLGLVIGIAAQLLFAATVTRLFLFLSGATATACRTGLIRDVLLALQFSVVHSLLLHPAIRGRLQRWVPRALYGSLFCLVTCATLLLLIAYWVASPVVIYQLTGPPGTVVRLAYFAAWLALFYSLCLSGMGYQTGFTPWWHWLRGTRPTARGFHERKVYRWFRHPIYLSFLGLIWFQPRMTLDHAVLTGVWTAYILVGSYLKDERMAHFIGEPYRDYQRRVPGFPFIAAGPSGRRRSVETSHPG